MSIPDIRVLLVDDQTLVRAGLRIILESEPGIRVIGEAADGAVALNQARELDPDVICMDVQMPGVDGLSATRSIIDDPEIHSAVLMLTTFDREDYLFAALQHGASGFILKNSTPEALIAAVQVLARGDALLAPDVTRRVIERCVNPGGTSASAAVLTHAAPSGLQELTEQTDTAADIEQRQRTAGEHGAGRGIYRIGGQLAADIAALQMAVVTAGDLLV